jgi:hypothetical protein
MKTMEIYVITMNKLEITRKAKSVRWKIRKKIWKHDIDE